ncbi:cadherin-related family member 5-like isoform X2 [Ambystoma mexicanum]|uniref:cadherin-related family member 5-like isoform X2 n=1 Tax=Ambystoma mexicanum TaxID=8296 RepID=UPI0037E7026B
MTRPSEVLLLALSLSFQLTAADQCSGGSNIFTEIQENSPNGSFIANLTTFGDPVTSSVRLCLSGTQADWFYLDGKTVRLNVSSGKPLDREALDPPVLMVTLTCSEEGVAKAQHRIIVQVLNENDNRPSFLEASIMAQNISELAEVDSVVFTAKAEDKDGDTLMYVLDNTMVDSKYFRIDMPNSGKLVLSRPLDYETKQELEFVIHVVEMNTKERYNSSARIHISVLDGDDQYPQFLPCKLLSHEGADVCVSPIYMANVTEGEFQTAPLQLSPGPVYAEDGDRGLMAAVTYSILPESDCFQIDNITGALVQLKPVESSRDTPSFAFSVMASQVNDVRKYSLTDIVIKVLAANRHPPRFSAARYQGFIQEDQNLAALVTTYSGRVLCLNASDGDFQKGSNPKIQFSLKQQSNHTELFQIVQNGLLLARANQLHALEQYFLMVIARDEESGETTNCTISVEVLRSGQAVPPDPAEPQRAPSLPDLAILLAGLGALAMLMLCLLFLIIRAVKARHRHQQSMGRGASLAIEKHPSVVNSSKSPTTTGDLCFQNEGYSELADESKDSPENSTTKPSAPEGREQHAETVKSYAVSSASTKTEGVPGNQVKHVPVLAVTPVENESAIRSILTNGKTPERSGGRMVWFEDVSSSESSLPSPQQRPAELKASVEIMLEKRLEHSTTGSDGRLNQTQAIVENEGNRHFLGPNLLEEIVTVENTNKTTGHNNSKSCSAPEDGKKSKDDDGAINAIDVDPIDPLGQSGEKLLIKPPVEEELCEEVPNHDPLKNTPSEKDDPTVFHPPPHGSEVITPGSLMQLLEDSIEC